MFVLLKTLAPPPPHISKWAVSKEQPLVRYPGGGMYILKKKKFSSGKRIKNLFSPENVRKNISTLKVREKMYSALAVAEKSMLCPYMAYDQARRGPNFMATLADSAVVFLLVLLKNISGPEYQRKIYSTLENAKKNKKIALGW